MIIKKFEGKTEEDAIETAKKELGSGIVIMNVKNVKPKGLFAALRPKLMEVTVALEEQETGQTVQRENLKAARATVKELDVKPAIDAIDESSQSIERKLDSLQTFLVSQFRKSEEEMAETASADEEKRDKSEEQPEKADREVSTEQDRFIRLLYNTMIDNEVDEKYANQILKDIDKSQKPNVPIDYILANVYQKMILKFGKAEGIASARNKPKVVMFIGPTGVGKTTTIAKIASSYAVGEKKSVALLTADTYRIAAAEQLRTYANILEVPFRVIYTEEELRAAISDFAEFDYIFVDTAGHSHQNQEQLEKMKSLLKAVADSVEYQAFLVLSATTKYKDLIKIAEKYKEIAEYQLIFTKLDETVTLGNLMNLKLHMDSPIAFVTYGQNVPDDIEQFNPQKTVKLLLGGKH